MAPNFQMVKLTFRMPRFIQRINNKIYFSSPKVKLN